MDDSSEASDGDVTGYLLRQVEAGDSLAFNLLFGRHREVLRALIARRIEPLLRSRIDPSDVVQEAQLEALDRLPEYFSRRPMPFRDWLRQTAIERFLKIRRHCLAARRDVGREDELARCRSAEFTFAAGDPTPSQQIASRDLAAQLHVLLGRLPETDGAILRMRAFDGLSYEQVANRMGLEPATARKRFGRALLRLRALLLANGLSESQL
jgi:RNA polymerase sigma-70 factor, ECF subfamily